MKTILGTTMLIMMTVAVSGFTTNNDTEVCCTNGECTMENCDKSACEGCCEEAEGCCETGSECCAGEC